MDEMVNGEIVVTRYIRETRYHQLQRILKRKSKGYKPKKSSVVLIMSYFGVCSSQELLNMKDIEDRDSVMVVNIPESAPKTIYSCGRKRVPCFAFIKAL
ncbi:hypothetical protein NQ317_015738 [Molorchus minor]|uniref:Uncharacterized protein n=1 Tax=Molorchus minor TaxID=1323400 RepID=A0ABQ9JBI1_9CUCU|nr:hypothetical protein NQ317_015738 [Molorchus minor]